MPNIRLTNNRVNKETHMRCPTCSSDTYVEINMTLGEKDVAFRRCGRCETQKWESGDEDVDLTSVLEYAKDLQI